MTLNGDVGVRSMTGKKANRNGQMDLQKQRTF